MDSVSSKDWLLFSQRRSQQKVSCDFPFLYITQILVLEACVEAFTQRIFQHFTVSFSLLFLIIPADTGTNNS